MGFSQNNSNMTVIVNMNYIGLKSLINLFIAGKANNLLVTREAKNFRQ